MGRSQYRIDEEYGALDGEALKHKIAVRRFIAESCELARLLPPAKKCLFLMHFESGLSGVDIAKLCGVDHGTVSRRLKAIVEELGVMRELARKACVSPYKLPKKLQKKLDEQVESDEHGQDGRDTKGISERSKYGAETSPIKSVRQII